MIDQSGQKVTLRDLFVEIRGIYIAGTGLFGRVLRYNPTRPPEDYDLSYSDNAQAESAKFCLSQTRDAANISIKQKRLVPSSLLLLSEDLHLFE